MRMPWRAGTLVLAMLVATAVAVLPANAGGPRTNATYVALGDSYASGEGLGGLPGSQNGGYEAGTDTPNGARFNMCHRSANDAYAVKVVSGRYLVRPTVKTADRAFWACSGATTETMKLDVGGLSPNDKLKRFRYKQPQQVAGTVGPSTRWISLSAGGNDVQFAKLVQACILAYSERNTTKPVIRIPGKPACDVQLKASTDKMRTLGRTLGEVYEELLEEASKAKLVVVGYPRVFPADMSGGASLSKLTAAQRKSAGIPVDASRLCRTNARTLTYWIGVDDSHARQLTTFTQDLNRTALRQVAALAKRYPGRIVFADTWSTSVPHNCSGVTKDPSVNGVRLSALGGTGSCIPLCGVVSEASFHPSRAGADRIGRVVEAAFAGALYSLGDTWKVTGKVGEDLTAQPILFTGGTGTVTVVPGVDGTIPSWLTMSAGIGTVTLGGTPTASGSWTFPLVLQDAAGHRLTLTIKLTVAPGAVVQPSGLGKVVADLGPNAFAIGFSPGEPLFAYLNNRADNNCDLRVRNTQTGADDLVATMSRCDRSYWSAEGTALVYIRQTATDKRIFVWDSAARTSTEIAPTMTKSIDLESSTSISADGRYVFFRGDPGSAAPPNGWGPGTFLHDRQTRVTQPLYNAETGVSEVTWAPTGHRMFGVISDGFHRIKNLCTGSAPACDQILWTDMTAGNFAVLVADLADRRRVAVGNSYRGEVKVIDTDGATTTAPAAFATALAFGSGGNVVGMSDYTADGRALLRWNYKTGALVEIGRISDGNPIVSPDGSAVIVTDVDKTVSIDVATGKVTTTPLPGFTHPQWNRTATHTFNASYDMGRQLTIWTRATNTTTSLTPVYCYHPVTGTSASGRYALVLNSRYCGMGPLTGAWEFIDLTTGKVVGSAGQYGFRQRFDTSPWASKGDIAYVYDQPELGTGISNLQLVAPQG